MGRGILKKLLLIMAVLMLTACSNEERIVEGLPLKIALIGEAPEIDDDKITFKHIDLETFSEGDFDETGKFDAVMVTPTMFEEASNDRFIEAYKNSPVPIIFFDSPKRHFPFVNDGVTYESAHWEALKDGSHTTIYINQAIPGSSDSMENTWYFELKKGGKLDSLYREVFRKVQEF